MASKVKQMVFSITDLIKRAQEAQPGPDMYANHAQVVITVNEFILDFYKIIPAPGKWESPVATHIQRVIIPHTMAKGLVSAINKTITDFELENKISILNPHDEDQMLPQVSE